MDRVRFGRALGYGARHAAKSLMQAADAASSPNQAASNQAASGTSRPASRAATTQTSPVVERLLDTRRTVAQTQQHAGKLGRSVWTPVARILKRPVAAGYGNFFYAAGAVPVAGAVEAARHGTAADRLSRGGDVLSAAGGVPRLRLLCDQQLCASVSAGTALGAASKRLEQGTQNRAAGAATRRRRFAVEAAVWYRLRWPQTSRTPRLQPRKANFDD